MYTKNISQRILICTMVLLLPLLLISLVALSLATAEASMSTSSFRPAQPVVSGITSDDFNACDLNTGLWTFVNPLNDSSYAMVNTFTDDAALEITVPGGSQRHSISTSNTDAPRMMQPVSDSSSNFEVEAKFDSAISQPFQVQGILVEGSGTNEFIRFEFFSDGSYVHVYAATLAGGTFNPRNDITITIPGPAESYYILVERSGNNWIQSYKTTSTSWTALDPFTFNLNVTAVGPYAGNSGTPPTIPAQTALVDYFFNTNSPINPEDEDRNELDLVAAPVAGGSVSKNPNKTSYVCNEEVSISATPNAGWAFIDWSGDWSGSTNPDIVTMTGSRQITANFSQQNTYQLTINTVGFGSVVKEPDKASYLFGDVVTVTAVANPGWTFSNWSGDITGNNNPANITMDSNKTITANFSPEQEYLIMLPIILKNP